jgi:hypothetical protein
MYDVLTYGAVVQETHANIFKTACGNVNIIIIIIIYVLVESPSCITLQTLFSEFQNLL